MLMICPANVPTRRILIDCHDSDRHLRVRLLHIRRVQFGYQPGDGPPPIFTADLSSFPLPPGEGRWGADSDPLAAAAAISSLRVGGQRMIRARYPNVRTVEQLDSMQVLATSWTPQSAWGISTAAAYTFNPQWPLRNDTADGFFQTFRIGVGGDCAFRFTPAAGYWCANGTQGGGPGPYQAPVGMTVGNSSAGLPHTPYSNPDGAVIHTWRDGRWFSWAFVVNGSSFNTSSGMSTFNFSLAEGGNQGSRGGDAGQEFLIENVLEELDAPGEFFWDATTRSLTLWYNGSAAGGPADDATVVAAQLRVLINASGSQAEPVVGIGFLGIGFRDTAPNYLGPHGMPSGGDWAVGRSAALFFQGTEGLRIDGCFFTSLDGNAVFLSGYTRNASILRSEFYSIGETAISLWGDTDGEGSPIAGLGYDASAGNQPRGTLIQENVVHEVGIFTKQNSAIFAAQAYASNISQNIFYNGPRAGININDGLGGGNVVDRNVLFNFCRESSDHGPINTWHRQPLFLRDANGQLTAARLNDSITGNFVIGNYHSSEPVDNDDGSAYVETRGNVLISAVTGFGSLKSDFGGNSNFHIGNLDLFFSSGFDIITPQIAGHEDAFADNTLWLLADGDYGSGQTCAGDGKTAVSGNTIWSPTGSITECGLPLAQWQAAGNDAGTVASHYPHDDTVLGIARQMLGL